LKHVGFITLIAMALASGVSGGTAWSQTHVKFASVGGITDAPLYIADEYGFFKDAGLQVEMQRMDNAPALTAAIVTNQIDAAGISLTPGLFSAGQQGMNLRIVGDKQSLKPGLSATRLIVRTAEDKGNEAATVAGMKGKAIAVSAKASSTYFLLVRLLAKHGMKPSEVRIVELAYPNMLPALTSGAVDAAIDLEPFLTQAIQAGAAKMVSDLSEFMPAGGSIVPIVYSEGFAAQTDRARAFIKAYMRGVRVYNDAFVKNKDKDKVVELIARRARVDRSVVVEGFPPNLDPDQYVSIDFFKTMQTFFLEQRFLRSAADLSKVVDPSFAEAAVKDLGPYK
jgi:NitT/TauT family transport system substrate-binding protein